MNRIQNRMVSFLGTVAVSFFLMVLPGGAFAAWESITPSGASNDFRAVASAGDFVYLATNSGVYGSADSGSSWDLGTGLGTSPYTSLAIAWYFDGAGYVADELTPIYLATGDGLYESTLGSSIWSNTGLSDVAVYDVEVDQFGVPTTLYAATENGVYRSDDAGAVWRPVNTGLDGVTVIGLTSDFAYGALYATVSSGDVYRSDLFSASGEDETWTLIYSGDVNDVSLLNAVGGITWLATSNGILKDDGLGNYEVVSIGLPDGGVHTIASDFTDSNIAYAAHATGGIYRTTTEAIIANGSYDAQWLPFNINLSAQSMVSVVTNPINPRLVYALSDMELYKTVIIDLFADVVAPGAITDLSVRREIPEDSTDTAVTLEWTRPGGDGDFGVPASYDVRYSTEVIETEDDWDEATQADGEPTPYGANTGEVFMVQPLLPNTRYYFAVRAFDDAGNRGLLSNVVEGSTDITEPVVATFNLPDTATTLIVPILFFTATDTAGVSGFIVTLSNTTPSVDNPDWSVNAPTNVTFPGSGTHTAYAWARDVAGNISESRASTVIITLTDTSITPPRGGGGGGGGRRSNDAPTEIALEVPSSSEDMTEEELKIHLLKQIIALLNQLIILLQQKM